MKLLTLIISSCCLLNVCFASATDWQSNPSKSRLNFAPSYEGMPINGRFGIFSVTYTTDAKDKPIHLSVKVSIASADMDNSDINEAIGAADWFNITDFPEAQFISDQFVLDTSGQLLAQGSLRLKGYNKAVTVPFRWETLPEGEASMIGELTLARNDFFIGDGEWATGEQIGISVKVWFNVVFSRAESSH